MKKRSTRRRFLQATAGAAGAALTTRTVFLEAEPALADEGAPVAPSDRVRFGIVGVGMQGNGLLRTSISLAGVECAAACDLYDGRHDLAREIAGEKVKVTRRYQELLDDRSIDCIVAAVPDHWHRRIVVDALAAGKDVYCEKPMSHSAADGYAMVAAAEKTGRLVQVGSQRTSSAICAKARELLAQGAIGDVLMVEGFLGRNEPSGAWQYPPPPDLSPANFDWDTWQGDVPKRAFDPVVYARWRCWRAYGTGVAGDLMVHLLSGMMFAWSRNEAPSRAQSMGGILRWKDGRDMPDVHTALFEYGDVPVLIRLTLGTETPEKVRFLGSKGILEMSSGTITVAPQTGTDSGPSWYAWSFPKDLRDAYMSEWHRKNDPVPGQEPIGESVTYRGPGYDDTRPHLLRFFQAVRSRQGIVQDAVFGNNAALACHMANESYFRNGPVTLDPKDETIRG
jgi:predicted dehydrogenase